VDIGSQTAWASIAVRPTASIAVNDSSASRRARTLAGLLVARGTEVELVDLAGAASGGVSFGRAGDGGDVAATVGFDGLATAGAICDTGGIIAEAGCGTGAGTGASGRTGIAGAGVFDGAGGGDASAGAVATVRHFGQSLAAGPVWDAR
jgi:hypothetical protein